MADYIYLLENRLSKAQQAALAKIREVARSKGLTTFLVGGAVRDLTSGSPVRDLDVVVQGNALKLKKDIEKTGAVLSGESEPTQSFFVRFPGSVRVEIGSTLSVSYPKPGKPVYKAATILDDLRRRDFTANSMALSLNDGSYGLLMDPLNGVADIENRELRLVSNYGFIEDPVRMIRAARFMARLGWHLDERTQGRYETGKQEGYISAMSGWEHGYETEEIFHEEDPLRVLRRLEAEGWMKNLNPAVGSAKANVAELEKLREVQAQLHMQGIDADMSTASFSLLTAKMAPKDVAALKKSFPRQAFVEEIEALDKEVKDFIAHLTGKGAALPSQAWKLIHSTRPEIVLWAAHTGKGAAAQGKFKAFHSEWPQARQKVPYTLMQEMRITPELAGYDELVEKLFFELMDGKLGTVEEMKAFLEPYSPPAPPPPVHLRKARAAKKESKAKAKKKAAAEVPAEGAGVAVAASEGVAEAKPAKAAKAEKKAAAAEKPAEPVKTAAKKAPAPAAKAPAVAAKKAPVKAVEKKVAAPAAKKAPAKKVVAKAPAKKAPVKAAAKKPVAKKVVAKAPAKKAQAKKAGVKKVAAKKPAAPAKKAAKKKR
jgi:tRNA nucleotidyltransferase (CCA-adding enzyme)